MNKRAEKVQTGGPAAGLVGVLTLLFLFYILFLPPAEREELLQIGNYSEVGEIQGVLLDESPGTISFSEKRVYDHTIPSVYLTQTKNAVVLGSENPFIVHKGWFSEEKKTMVFSVDDLENTESVVLSFQAVDRAGFLSIFLNGNKIFEGEIKVQNPIPILLPKALLRPANQIEFTVTGGFFSRKRYTLSDVKVIGDITDVKKQMATNTFTISDTERESLDTAFLDFFPICDQRSIGLLTIELNGRTIYSAVPSCDSLNRQDIFAEDLRTGRNTLVFRIDRGSYRVEQIRLRTVLEPIKSYIDYFNIKSLTYNEILDRRRQVIVRIEFVDDKSIKHAELNVNGKRDVIDQRDDVYERDISSRIREGNNYIEIKPLTELEIPRLIVRAD